MGGLGIVVRVIDEANRPVVGASVELLPPRTKDWVRPILIARVAVCVLTTRVATVSAACHRDVTAHRALREC